MEHLAPSCTSIGPPEAGPVLPARSLRVVWIGGALNSAFLPSRLAAGVLLALLIWLPGLGWDTLTGTPIDATGFLGEPYDDAEQDAVQATLRRMATDYAPDFVFESARVPAAELAAVLEARAAKAPDAGSRETLLIAAAHAGSLAPLGSFQALLRADAAAASMLVDGVFSASPADVALGVRMACWDTPKAVWQRDPVFAVAFGLWCALTLAVGAGAIARMEALQLAGRGVVRAVDGYRFAAERWADLVLAWIAPLGIAGGLGLLCVAWGTLFRTEWGGWLGAALYIVPLAIGLVAGIALVVWAAGAPLAPAAVACDGLDSLDASQRGAIYALARPGAWLASIATVVVVGGAGLALARIIAWVVTSFTAASVSLGAGASAGAASGAVGNAFESLRVAPDAATVSWSGPGVVIGWWVSLASVCAAGAFLSLLGGLLTRSYLALRERCDGQPRFECWPFEGPTDASDAA